MISKGSSRVGCRHASWQIHPFGVSQVELDLHPIGSTRHAAPVDRSADATHDADRQNTKDGSAVGGVGAGVEFLPVRPSIAVRVSGAVVIEIAEVSHFPIVVQTILIRVRAAESQHVKIARVVEVSGRKIGRKARKNNRPAEQTTILRFITPRPLVSAVGHAADASQGTKVATSPPPTSRYPHQPAAVKGSPISVSRHPFTNVLTAVEIATLASGVIP